MVCLKLQNLLQSCLIFTFSLHSSVSRSHLLRCYDMKYLTYHREMLLKEDILKFSVYKLFEEVKKSPFIVLAKTAVSCHLSPIPAISTLLEPSLAIVQVLIGT